MDDKPAIKETKAEVICESAILGEVSEVRAAMHEFGRAITEALLPVIEWMQNFDWRGWRRILLEDKLSQWPPVLFWGRLAHFIAYHLPGWAIDKMSFDWLIGDSVEEKL